MKSNQTNNVSEYKRILEKEAVLYRGRIFEVVKQYLEFQKHEHTGIKEIEVVRRSPGVRALIIGNDKILFIKEYRSEHQGWDFRLPGGKIFDTLDEYLLIRQGGDLLQHATLAVVRELLEETGVIAHNPKLFTMSRAGATVIWDLYYFEISDFELGTALPDQESDEIIYSEWKTMEEAKKLCLDGEVKEDRTVGVLLRYILLKEDE